MTGPGTDAQLFADDDYENNVDDDADDIDDDREPEDFWTCDDTPQHNYGNY